MPSLIQKRAHVKGQRSNHHIFKFQPNPSWAKKRPNRYTSFCVILCNVCESSFMAGFTETTSVDFETIAESLITLVSSLIAEKIFVSLLPILLSFPISVSSMSVSEIDLSGALAALVSLFPFPWDMFCLSFR